MDPNGLSLLLDGLESTNQWEAGATCLPTASFDESDGCKTGVNVPETTHENAGKTVWNNVSNSDHHWPPESLAEEKSDSLVQLVKMSCREAALNCTVSKREQRHGDEVVSLRLSCERRRKQHQQQVSRRVCVKG
jgi:hypothetical protein